MLDKLLDIKMHDGSRNFTDLPETVFFEVLHEHTKKLDGAKVTRFVSDWITEVWLDFEFRGHKFSVNNQFGDYWFYVENSSCPDKVLLEVCEYFRKLLEK